MRKLLVLSLSLFTLFACKPRHDKRCTRDTKFFLRAEVSINIFKNRKPSLREGSPDTKTGRDDYRNRYTYKGDFAIHKPTSFTFPGLAQPSGGLLQRQPPARPLE